MEAAKELGLKPVSKNKIFKFYGTPLKNMVKKFWPKANPEEFEDLSIKKIKKLKFKTFNGAKSTVNKLSKTYKLGLLSSKSKVLMDLHIKENNISRNLFGFIYSKEDIKYHKPDSRAFSRAVKKLKLKREEILYVGDSIYDCISAKKAKINFVAVLTGHYARNEFKKHKVKNSNILKSINKLPKWLEENEK